MKKNNFSIELPFFCGFYESPFYNCDTLYWEFHDEDAMEWYKEKFDDETLTEDDLDLDFAEYEKDICLSFIESFKNLCPDFVETMEYDEMISPKYYNYSTDKLYAKITLAENWREVVLKFMEDNKDWVSKRVREDWTSYDGFMSFLDNYYDAWYAMLSSDEPDERYVSVMIGYMMYFENKDIREDLIRDTLDDIYIGNYVICTKKAI